MNGSKMLVRLEDGARMPERATKGAGGYDLAALESVVIRPEQMEKVRTGVHVSIGEGLAGLLLIRSGLSRLGLSLSTGVSLIDSDYTGEIVAYVRNRGEEAVMIKAGERFCQLAIVGISTPDLEETDALPDTERGGDGFGSTGK